MNTLSAWLLPGASLLALAIFVSLAVVALGGDRARGRRRCAKCWHEFAPKPERGAAVLRCVECGWIAKHEAQLARPKRKLLQCGVWIACASTVGLWMQWHFANLNLWTIAPTRVLLWSIDLAEPTGQSIPAREELVRRILRNDASSAAQQSLLQSMVSRYPDASGTALEEWRARWERPIRAWLATVDADSRSRDALLRIPLDLKIDAPVCAIVGARLQVAFAVDEYWPENIEGRLEIRSSTNETFTVLFDPAGYRGARTGLSFAASPFTPRASDEAPSIQFTVQSAWRPKVAFGTTPHAWNQLAPQSICVPIAQPRVQDDLLTPFESAALADAVTSAFSDGLVRWTLPPARAGLRFDVGATGGSEFRDILIGVRATIRDGATVVRTSHLWWCAQEGNTVGWSMSIEDTAALARAAPGEPAGWTLTLEGDPTIAAFLLPEMLQDGALQPTLPLRYFSGVIEIPLSITDYDALAPPRRFRPET